MDVTGSVTVPRSDAVASVLALAAGRTGRPVLLVDGGSGAGKTVLADEVVEAWRPGTLQRVRLDDVYEGWYGLAAASHAVVTDLLRPDGPGHRTWDWAAARRGPWVPLDPDLPLLVEGCGALTGASARLATVRVWLELDEPERRRRALARDEGYEPWWEVWAAQEREHWARHRPWELADLVVTAR